MMFKNAVMRFFLLVNMLAFGVFGLFSTGAADHFFVGRMLHGLAGVTVLFVLPGIHVAALFQTFFKKKLADLEFFVLAALSSILLIPFALSIEYHQLGFVAPYFPLINALLIFAGTSVALFFQSRHVPKNSSQKLFDFFSIEDGVRRRSFLRALFPPFLFYGLIAIVTTASFYPLPDLDPYYWLIKFRSLFSHGELLPLSYRPLFASLSYIFIEGAGIDSYAFFKYILPSFFLVLSLPVLLIARSFSDPARKIIIFLFPFVSGISLIYLTLPIPQALASIVVFFFVSLLTHSNRTHDRAFFWIGGATLFLGYFYHEILAIPLAIWLATAAWFFRKTWFTLIREHRIVTILLLFILLPLFSEPVGFVISRGAAYLPEMASFHGNMLFPLRYVNVDGYEMGWGDLRGVIKYYLFYAGPVVLLVCILAGYRLFTKSPVYKMRSSPTPEGVALAGSLMAFLAIAEIIPRVPGVALLPDRSWVVGGFFFLFPLTLFLRSPKGANRAILLLIISAFLLNIAAALSINSLKRYVITDAQLQSADWIRKTLPENRMFFCLGNENLLRFFSDSAVVPVKDPAFFFNKADFNETLSAAKDADTISNPELVRQFSETQKTLSLITEIDKPIPPSEMKSAIKESIKSLRDLERQVTMSRLPPRDRQPRYVYLSLLDPRNPYRDRPYLKNISRPVDDTIFRKFPSEFREIYADPAHGIFVWEIL